MLGHLRRELLSKAAAHLMHVVRELPLRNGPWPLVMRLHDTLCVD